MNHIDTDIAVIGSGPAGMAAAVAAREAGVEHVLLIERDERLGGILPQCIHNGFGLHLFGEELTGPEYADRFIEQVDGCGVARMLDSMVLDLGAGDGQAANLMKVASPSGMLHIAARAVVLAMGCRERPRGAVPIAGSRPAGIFTAGTAQRLVNVEGILPGRRIVILGSGDIGLIMARRLTLEGVDVEAVVEIRPHPGGLIRNIVQCLYDFEIPLRLGSTVTQIHGRHRVEAVTVAQVGADGRPVPGSEERLACDTLLLSCGLIPENELSRQLGLAIDERTGGPVVHQDMGTSRPGVFAAGDVVFTHNLVDHVSLEGRRAGESAARFIGGEAARTESVAVLAGAGSALVSPQRLRLAPGESVSLSFRPSAPFDRAETVLEDAAGSPVARQPFRVLRPAQVEQIRFELPERIVGPLTLRVGPRPTGQETTQP